MSSQKRKLQRMLRNHPTASKKVIQLKKSWDEVTSILKSTSGKKRH